MKNLLIVIAFVISLASCSKPNDIARNSVETEPMVPKIEFKFNGELKQYFDISAGSSRVTGVKYYTFVGHKAPVADNVFNLTILADSLRVGTYAVAASTVVSFQEGKTVATNTSDFEVTITSNVNGLINGTFHGSLYNHTASAKATCVQGKIENVQLTYK